MARNIQDLEGIGPKYAALLKQQGIDTTDQLLQVAGSGTGRRELAEKTAIGERRLLKWVNMCDLFRIRGVAGQFAELLEGAGVDTIRELRNRNAHNLALQLSEINDAARLCRTTPGEKTVADWIRQAKSLQPMVTHQD